MNLALPSSCFAVLLGLAGAATAAFAQGERFPSQPVTLWMPWPAGAATDNALRVQAEAAGRYLGQKMIVENRGGAGGTLVMPVLRQAAPDGYTIAQMPQPVFRAPWMQQVHRDQIRNTTPITQLGGVTFGIVVQAGSTLRSVEDLFTLAAAHPGQMTLATNGVGTKPHMVTDQLFGDRSLA